MAANSKIEWCTATWNFIAGCDICSKGCKNCYAMKMAARLEAMGQAKYAGITKKVNGQVVWTGKINVDEKALLLPFKWKKPKRVFVNSMSDLFHPDVPFDLVDKAFAVMALCPQHTFQILTKRPERMAEYLNDHIRKQVRGYMHGEYGYLTDIITPVIGEAACDAAHAAVRAAYHGELQAESIGDATAWPWPLPNVWLGTSCEDQKRADERIPYLLRCPAAIRFLSCEPLLGPIDLNAVSRTAGAGPEEITDEDDAYGPPFGGVDGISWTIIGGESGRDARPCSVEWVRELKNQCAEAGVACFIKQLGAKPVEPIPGKEETRAVNEPFKGGGWACWRLKDSHGGDMEEWPEDLRVRQFPQSPRPAAEVSR